MSVDLAQSVAGLGGVGGALAEIRACQSDFGQFCAGLFQQLETLANELFHRQQQNDRAALQAQQAARDASQEESAQLARLVEAVERQQASWEASVRELRAQQQTMHQTQAAAQAQLGRLAEVAERLCVSQQNLAAELSSDASIAPEISAVLAQAAAQQERWTALEQTLSDRLEAMTALAAQPAAPRDDARLAEMAAALERLGDDRAAMQNLQAALQGQLAQLQAAAEAWPTAAATGEAESAAKLDELFSLVRQSQDDRAAVQQWQTALDARLEKLTAQSAGLSDTQAAAQWRDDALRRDADLESALDEAREERRALRATQEAVAGQLERLAGVAADLAETRGEIGQRWQEIATAAADRGQEDVLRRQVEAMSAKQTALERERLELEFELEAVRGRAAELTESLGEQRRLLSQQQNAWGDFQRMLRLLENISDRATVGSHADDAVGEPNVIPVTKKPAPDPVLDSVAAQFEMLRKDVARRRAGGA